MCVCVCVSVCVVVAYTYVYAWAGSISVWVYAGVDLWVSMNVYMLQQLHLGSMWHKVNFKQSFTRFEFKVFLHLDRLPYQD